MSTLSTATTLGEMDLSEDEVVPLSAPHLKKRKPHDMVDLRCLPPGQRRAVVALLGGGTARTYPEAAKLAGMGLGTLHTHLGRIRQGHPDVYAEIRRVRSTQLAVRHRLAQQAARAHSRAYFRRQARWMRRILGVCY